MKGDGRVLKDEQFLVSQSSCFHFETLELHLPIRKQCFQFIPELEDGELESADQSPDGMEQEDLRNAMQFFVLCREYLLLCQKCQYHCNHTKTSLFTKRYSAAVYNSNFKIVW